MSYRIDLHTHSIVSPDGGLSPADYETMLTSGQLHAIAVTDHDRIDLALRLHKKLGSAIIVGEEIKCEEGEIIGLYLTSRIKPGLPVAKAVEAIREQNGLVYVPHPFETVRSGLSETAFRGIADQVDIIETHNGRAVFQDRSQLTRKFRVQYGMAGSAASDAHSRHGWGRTYTTLTEMPTRKNLLELLQAAETTRQHPGVRGLLAPKINRLHKRMRRG